MPALRLVADAESEPNVVKKSQRKHMVEFVKSCMRSDPNDDRYLGSHARYLADEIGLEGAERVFKEAGKVFEVDPWRWMR